VDDGRPVIAALLHGGGDGVILGRVIDDVEVGEEEVDNAVGGRELTMQPRHEAVTLVYEPGCEIVHGGHHHHGASVMERLDNGKESKI
jgi:hypothetical protein